ncbi:SpaA isopeptide-forming pilin-related protein [Oscillospiraceae bacterium LTW-04]|nr:SpaA isopeptide-forming pilin-related protein [Oscillospiraceae bacterium MB24-C1]
MLTKNGFYKTLSFAMACLLMINACLFTINAATDDGSLYKNGIRLKDGDHVTETDELTWQLSISDKAMAQGVTIILPDRLLPNITGANLDDLFATTEGNEVYLWSETNHDSGNLDSGELVSGDPDSSEVTMRTVRIPCIIDVSQVHDGQINIAGMNLNVILSAAMPLSTPTFKAMTADPVISLFTTKSEAGKTVADQNISDVASVSMYDEFLLRFNWDNLGSSASPSDFYEFDLPEEVSRPTSTDSMNIYPVPTAAYPGFPVDKPFAVLSWEAGNPTLRITFQDLGQYEYGGNIYNAFELLGQTEINFLCNLDRDALDADDQGRVTIGLPSSVTVVIDELVPKPPQLNKTAGEIDEHGEVEWTITYTHPTQAYHGEIPTKLVDVLPDGMDYVANSALTSVDNVAQTGLVNFQDGILSCDLSSIGSGETLTLTYKTRLTDSELQKIWLSTSPDQRYSNAVTAVHDSGAVTTEGDGSYTVVVDDSWQNSIVIQKDSRTIAPASDGDLWRIDWTITVRTASRNFKTLEVIDTLGKGLNLEPGSIVIKADDSPYTADTVITSMDGKTVMTVKLIESGIPETAAAKYEIKYSTTVKPEYFEQTGDLTDESLKNFAQLRYEWKDSGSGTGLVSPPAIEKNPSDINNDLIRKDNGQYDYVNHKMPWTITVNPNKVNLTEVKLEDDLSSSSPAHRFVADDGDSVKAIDDIRAAVIDGLTQAGLDSAVLSDVTIVDNKLTILLGNLGENSFKFTINTYVSDNTFWASNQSGTFRNTIVMKQDGTKVNGLPISKDVSANDYIKVYNEVLSKKHIGFDPKTKKVTWALTVNKNALNLGDVTITDTLAQHLICNVDDAKLDGTAFSGDNTFEVDGQNITIRLKDVQSKHIITFTTTIDINAQELREQPEISFVNSADIVSTTNNIPVNSGNANLKVITKVLNKNSPLISGMIAHYTIDINPLGLDLLDDQAAGSKLQAEDTLPDGLYLDLESIKLYEATPSCVSSGGTYSVVLTPNSTPIENATIDFDPQTRKLTVDIPNASARYVLTYDTFIVRTDTNLVNSVSLVGSVIPQSSENSNALNSMYISSSGFARMTLPAQKFVSIQIKKIDGSKNILQGAKFGLFANKTDTEPLVQATCDDATGICTLAVPKSLVNGLTTLYWKELAAPSGYALSNEWHELDIASHDPTAVIDVVNVDAAQSTSARIELIKTNDVSEGLAGAIFALYLDNECTIPVLNSSGEEMVALSDTDGKVTFNDLYPEQTYYIKELRAPVGYVLSELVTALTAKQTWASPHQIVNEANNVTLTLTKTDAIDAQNLLAGAVFALYDTADCSGPAIAQETTDSGGKLSFSGLAPQTHYYVKEVLAPGGYLRTTDIYHYFSDTNNNTITGQIGNYPIGWDEKGMITITKTNVDGTLKLSGARFALYRDDKVTRIGEKDTDQNGICTFTGLAAGTYYIKEVQAPSGYALSSEWFSVKVTLNSSESITIENKPTRRAPKKYNGEKPKDPWENFNLIKKPAPLPPVVEKVPNPKTGAEDI